MTQSGHKNPHLRPFPSAGLSPPRCLVLSRGGGHEAAGIYRPYGWRGRIAVYRTRATTGDAGDRLPPRGVRQTIRRNRGARFARV
jgi:hypothetical protein